MSDGNRNENLVKIWVGKDMLQQMVNKKFLSKIQQLEKEKETEKQSRQENESELLSLREALTNMTRLKDAKEIEVVRVKKELASFKRLKEEKDIEVLRVKKELASFKENSRLMEQQASEKENLIAAQMHLLQEYYQKNPAKQQSTAVTDEAKDHSVNEDENVNDMAQDDVLNQPNDESDDDSDDYSDDYSDDDSDVYSPRRKRAKGMYRRSYSSSFKFHPITFKPSYEFILSDTE